MFSIIGAAGLTLANNLLIVIWIILLFTSAIGLYLKINWGFFFFYPGVLLTTIGFSIPLIPFVISVFAPLLNGSRHGRCDGKARWSARRSFP